MKRHVAWLLFGMLPLLGGCGSKPEDLYACLRMSFTGFRPIADTRDQRFLGKVQEATARCRGGARAVSRRAEGWIDWPSYWATGDRCNDLDNPPWARPTSRSRATSPSRARFRSSARTSR